MAGKGSASRPMAIKREEFRNKFDVIDWSQPIDEPTSPCIAVCQLENDICIGCGRTIEEITNAGNMMSETPKE